jgi:RNA polymerase sigma-70 factor (ECF subfamily)
MKPGIEAEVLRKHLPRIEAYFRARVMQLEDAEDLCQEAAYQVIRSWGRFQHRASVGTWIYSICRNILAAYLRQKSRDFKRDADLHLNATHRTTEEERRIVEVVIDSMNHDFKVLYDLYYRKRHTVKEISRLIGKPEGTVKYELYVLRKKAKSLLA